LPLRLDPELAAALGRIGPLVDFVVITSNGPHLLTREIERAAGRPVLSMLDRVVEEIGRRRWKKVGLLALGPPRVYAERLDPLGIACESLDAERQARLDQAIFRVMEGRDDDAARQAAHEAVNALRARGVDGVILGCTEIPFLVRPDESESDLINPIQLLAEAAVEFAAR
jgi:aspartate racemase